MIGILVVAVALLFPIPYLGVQLGASGLLFNVLTDDMVPKNVGHVGPVASMWLPAGCVDTLQCLLLAFGIIAIGLHRLRRARWLGRLQRAPGGARNFQASLYPDAEGFPTGLRLL